MLKEDILRHIFIVFLAFFTVFFAGCQKKPVAVVNDEEVSQKMFDWYLAERLGMLKQQGTTMEEETLKTVVLEELISERLLVQGAREKGISISDEEVGREVELISQKVGEDQFRKDLKDNRLTMEEFREVVRDKLMMNRFAEYLLPEPEIKEEEIEDFYSKYPEIFKRPAQVLVRLIKADSEDKARAILDEMKQEGIGFDEMADRLQGEEKAMVSNYGWANPEMFGPEISASLEGLADGDFGGPYKGGDSYYVIMKKDSREEGVVSLEEASSGIRSLLIARERQSAVTNWLDENRQNATIITD
jgi:parvulin-like peptidyl-prolyl isomerase